MIDLLRSLPRGLVVCSGFVWALSWVGSGAPTGRVVDDTPLVGLSVPSRSADVAPEQSGKIVSIPVQDGDLVAKGQVLFELSSSLERLEVNRLRALAESDLIELRAKTSLDHAQREESRVRQLRSKDISSDSDLQKQTYEVDLARVRLDQAKLEKAQAANELAQAEERLAQRTLRSPIDGIVTRRFKHEGESVEKFVPVIQVIGLDPLWIEFECPVSRESEFRVGAVVDVSPAVRSDDVRVGEIVHASVQATPSSHTFLVRVTVPNRDRSWKAGLKMLIRRRDASLEQSPAEPPK